MRGRSIRGAVALFSGLLFLTGCAESGEIRSLGPSLEPSLETGPDGLEYTSSFVTLRSGE